MAFGSEADMPIPLQSKAVANHFLELAGSESGITLLKMQKLVYFAQRKVFLTHRRRHLNFKMQLRIERNGRGMHSWHTG